MALISRYRNIARSKITITGTPPIAQPFLRGYPSVSETVTEQHPASHPSLDARGAAYWKLATAYLLLLIYGALFPLSGWDTMRGGLHALFPIIWPTQVSRSDVITNLVVYLPLGLLLMLSWRPRYGGWSTIALATLLGGGLSFGLEYLQSYLPQRVPSLLDTALNVTGTLLGALFAKFIQAHSYSGGHLHRWRHRWFLAGALPNIGLTVLGLWAFSQLAPLVPSFDRGNLVDGIRPLLQVLVHHTAEFNPLQALGYGLGAAGLGLLAATVFKPGQAVLRHYAAFVLLVLVLKIPVVSRQLSFEAVAGVAVALLLFSLLLYLPRKGKALLAGLLVLSAYAVEQLRAGPDPNAPLLAMNWIPFSEHMENLNGIADITSNLWPFAALAYLTLFLHPRNVFLIGGVLVFAYTLGLEWLQTYIPGRYPDLTDACLAVLGWMLPWLLPRYGEAVAPAIDSPISAPHHGKHHSIKTVPLFLVFITFGLLAGWRLIPTDELRDEPPAEGRQPAVTQLPAPEDLRLLPLPNFRHSHPRLPAPSQADIARLHKENPDYLAQQRLFAGQGRLQHSLLQAYIEPGSQDLTALLSKLLALQFTWRGHEQTKPLAVAYDWLYDQWNETQRTQLRAKLAEGCEYQIRYIREERLSPYNVYLYNSPLQALMACAIALYGDDPRGDPVMAFTADYWKNRVLPVWRQIMGKNGGWHEGGEYVGIGIGQAIYELPAMWRKATGEDYFKTEPGIRGFLDFLVYRTRPDGTHMRLGDAGFFDKLIPDRLALAMEFRHAAAYNLPAPHKAPVPTSWPWGPLTDASLENPHAIENLPLTAHFDGLGLLVARSDWSPDATYITFKAGDNYWSHSHLDQGAFTVYKGGALAIDSGLYGPGYGADHHMNYTYQTIAHNTLTVTDPDDIVPTPARDKKPPRDIANDGGQRRIGSGWGVEAAPLDLSEWQQKRDIYHTGRIEKTLIENGLTVASADLTPAYTNELSGKGSFSHRTRRVEEFRRLFGYDNIDDVIVIYDRVTATDADFRKRWLLHTLQKPEITNQGFIVRTPSAPQAGHAGGRMEAHVLLPASRYIQLMGGPGFNYFVEDKNYDEGVADALQKKPLAEAGAWRVEILPDAPHETDEFLVVLLPTLGANSPTHQVHQLKMTDGVGVEIVGPHRTTRWRFGAAQGDARVEVITASEQQSYDLNPAN